TLHFTFALTRTGLSGNQNKISIICTSYSNSKSSASFVGTACPGVGRGRRFPQRMCNTPRRLLLAAAVSSLIWKWDYALGRIMAQLVNDAVGGHQ
ncbi:MAG: hypothetical protein ABRQ33_08675, partial [Smithellaceae bacterium]